MKTATIKISNKEVSFKNQVDFCVGTGRWGLALQAEYMDQLEYVQNEIGFKYIRGHGLFTDDMAIYHNREDRDGNKFEEYNFTYLNLVVDNYIKRGIKPFLELGFMPKDMASGDQTIFYWRGNVTPPAEYSRWNKMVQETLKHLMKRYGEEEVLTWPIEVWNEPNLPGFWKDANMEEYFKLFKETFYAIKEVNPKFRVGGPAICGVDDVRWMQKFMEFCSEEKIPLDFVTRHHYTTEMPEPSGHYGYQELSNPDDGFNVLQVSRDIIDSFPEYKGLEMHITEFNTSYIPNNPLHDTNQNAAYISYLLSKMGDMNESYSYWTFGDIFEEWGVPFSPFHGGFGMVANGIIPKPTFWAFKFFKDIKDSEYCVARERNFVVMKSANGYKGVIWNDSQTRTGEALKVDIELPEDEYVMVTKLVSEECTNPLKAWEDMGEPRSLTKSQLAILKSVAQPKVGTEVTDGKLSFEVAEHGVLYFELEKRVFEGDRGYDYERTMQFDK